MRVQVGDIRMFVDVEGLKLVPDGPIMRERPTLVLLHGGPGFDHSIFKPDFSELTDVAQVVYFDHRGNGRSDRSTPDRWNLAQWGDDVRALCEALEIERPIVLGTSFGGFVAQAYATRHPDHPAKLILCSTAATVRFERALAVFERLGGLEARGTAERFFANPTTEAQAEYARVCLPLYTRKPDPNLPLVFSRTIFNNELMAAFFTGEHRRFNFLPALARVKCPTLVLAGEDDPITPLADSEDIAAALPASLVRFERFPNAGHGIVTDARERFMAILRNFIAA